MQLVVQILLPHIQVALVLSFPEGSHSVLDGYQPIVWCVQVRIDPTTGAIINHSYVSLSVVNTEVVCPTRDLPRLDVPSPSYLHHLFPHQFMLEGVLGLGLLPQERLLGSARHKMRLPIPYFVLIFQPPIPEEGGRALDARIAIQSAL